ncbi:MAG: KUP/HAK/KT family potassium transporter [Betaproteobacteria bacterium]|nr:KUP/HAK/KT family potassium transporter [Betaproteobacteria bacterium]
MPGASKGGESASVAALTLTALGVVFGDIGTSPLYAFKEAFSGEHGLPLGEANVLAVLSLMFWSIACIVALALAARVTREQPRLAKAVVAMGIFGAALFYGDAVITPAISVLSAVEGLSVATPAFEHWILPITIGVLIGLFTLQKGGTGSVGRLFGPVMVLWFAAIGTLGTVSIAQTPAVLAALDPRHALDFMVHAPGLTFVVLGAVFLAVTGAEALYADMGHFGPNPIRIAWFGLAFPALLMSYFGQGALVLRDPAALKNPFYLLAPEELLLPLVALATAATVIASQATISASAYGVAVSGMMVLTTGLIAVIVLRLSRKAQVILLPLLAVVGLMEAVFFAANSFKIADGGWISLACGAVIFVMLTTWKRAETVLAAHEARSRIAVKAFPAMCDASIPRVPGTAVYMSPDVGWIPTVLLHNLKHNKVLHERVVFLTIVDEDVPRVPDRERTEVQVIERGRMYQAALHYGFMEDPDVPMGMKLLERHGLKFNTEETTFFLGKSTIARAARPGLFTWRRELFRWMQRNSPATAEYFNLVPNRVIELGTRLSI